MTGQNLTAKICKVSDKRCKLTSKFKEAWDKFSEFQSKDEECDDTKDKLRIENYYYPAKDL